LSLSGVPGLSSAAITNASLELNTTNSAASATVGNISFNYTTADRLNFFAISGHLDLTVTAGSVSAAVSGDFGFEKTTMTVNTIPNTSIIKASVQNASTSLT